MENLSDEQGMALAMEQAKKAECERARCGSVLVKDGRVIGEGFNRPPGGLAGQKRCAKKAELGPGFKSDRTCCVHAEQRAIMDGLAKNPSLVLGSKLYFARVDQGGDKLYSGQPYCTICSKMALEVGVAEFVLWHETGITSYPTPLYNDLSFAFGA